MADPVTWMTVFAVTGTAMSAMGAIRQGQAQAASANYNAAIAKENAKVARQEGQAAAEQHSRDTQRKIGSMVAQYGASGVDPTDGSPMDVLTDSVRSATLDNLNLRYGYTLKGLGLQQQSTLYRAEATNARTSSYFNAASDVLGGGAQIADYYPRGSASFSDPAAGTYTSFGNPYGYGK